MKQIIKSIPTEEDMLMWGAELAAALPHAGVVIFLEGSLGAGKTTFTRGFLRGLGFLGKVKSPTYTLVEPYNIKDHRLFHFDLYRLHEANELHDIGIREYFSPDNICLIEWPEKGFPLLPRPDLTCYIAFVGVGREMRVESHSVCGDNILEKIA